MVKRSLNKVIGERLRLLRKKKALSQEELANLANLHPTYIGQLERGEKNATLNTLDKISVALDVTLGELFQFNEQQNELNSRLNNINKIDREAINKIVDVMLDWKNHTEKKAHF